VGTWGDDTGRPIDVSAFPDKTVQMSGTFGAAVVIEGSNDVFGKSVWNTLVDPQGTAISMSSAGIEEVLENPYWIRPNAGAVTAVVVRLVCSRSGR